MGKEKVKKIVSKDSAYSGVNKNQLDFSRLTVRVLEGKHLLASDVVTGKSDPVCFLVCGSTKNAIEALPKEAITDEDLEQQGIRLTQTINTTLDPIWNEDVVFRVDMKNIKALSSARCLVYVRDEDIEEDGSVTFDELGLVNIRFRDIIINGKVMNKNSIVLSSAWYLLEKSPGMTKVEGSIKLTISLVFEAEDFDVIASQLVGIVDDLDELKTTGVAGSIQNLFSTLKKSGPPGFGMNTSRSSLSMSSSRSSVTGTSPSRLRNVSTGVASGGRPSSAFSLRGRDNELDVMSRQSSARSVTPTPRLTRGNSGAVPVLDLSKTGLGAMVKARPPNSAKPASKAPALLEVAEEDGGAFAFAAEGGDEDGNYDVSVEETDGAVNNDIGYDKAGSLEGLPLEVLQELETKMMEEVKKLKEKHISLAKYIKGAEANLRKHNEAKARAREAEEKKAEEEENSARDGGDSAVNDQPTTATADVDKDVVDEDMIDAVKDTAASLDSTIEDAEHQLAEIRKRIAKFQEQPADMKEFDGDQARAANNEQNQKTKVKGEKEDTAAAAAANGKDNKEIKNVSSSPTTEMDELSTGRPSHGDESLLPIAEVIDAVSTVGKDIMKSEGAGNASSYLKEKANELIKQVGADLADATSFIIDTAEKIKKPPALKAKAAPVRRRVPESSSGTGIPRENSGHHVEQPSTDLRSQIDAYDDNMIKRAGKQEKSSKVSELLGRGNNNKKNSTTTVSVTTDAVVVPEDDDDPMHALFANGPDVGDYAENMGVNSDGGRGGVSGNNNSDYHCDGDSEPERTQPLNRAQKKYQQAAAAARSYDKAREAAAVQQQQLSRPHSGGSGGSQVEIVRALKELAVQKEEMQQVLIDLARVTKVGLKSLSDRLATVEDKIAAGIPLNTAEMNLLAHGPGQGDESDLPPNDDEELVTEAQPNSKTSVANAKLKAGTLPNRSKSAAPGGTNASAAAGGASLKTKSSSLSKTTRTKAKPPGEDRANSNKPWLNKSRAKSANSSSYGSGGGGGGATVQLVYKGADGEIATKVTPLEDTVPTAPSNSEMAMFGSLLPPGSGDQSLPPPAENDYSKLQQQQQQQQQYYHHPSQQQTAAGVPPIQKAQSPSRAEQNAVARFNADFAAALDGGSLLDLADLLDSCAPNPEVLSVQTRNRLYDGVATLLCQYTSCQPQFSNPATVERCLIWCLALVKGSAAAGLGRSAANLMGGTSWSGSGSGGGGGTISPLLSELVGHTRRDLQEALGYVAQEPSKRGLLASILKSQIARSQQHF